MPSNSDRSEAFAAVQADDPAYEAYWCPVGLVDRARRPADHAGLTELPVPGKAIVWLLAGDGSWARAEEASGRVHQSGALRLWDDLERIRARWEEAGRFPLHDLTVEFTPEATSVTSPDGEWTIRL